MKIDRSNISPGTVLWFRKKGSWAIGCLTVQAVRQDSFTFKLKDGSLHSCSYAYASGRLYKNRSSLSSYKPGVDMANTYGGWAGKASCWGDPYDAESLLDHSLPSEDDDWIARTIQDGIEQSYNKEIF